MLELFKEKKLLKAKGKQRTDSTHVLAAVRVLNRLEMVVETISESVSCVYYVTNWQSIKELCFFSYQAV
jgi:transposase